MAIDPAARGMAAAGINAARSTISGNPNGVLTCTLPDAIASASYQWTRDGVNISGETNSTYQPVLADSGHVLDCRLTSVVWKSSNTVSVPASDMATPGVINSVSLVGDSITAQSTSTSGISFQMNSIGYVNWINANSGNRFPYDIAQNFGVSGNTITNINTTKASTIGVATGDAIFLLAGTNDLAAASSTGSAATILAACKSAWTSTVAYARGLGKYVIACTVMPRNLDGGVVLPSYTLQAIKDFNTWLLQQKSKAGGVLVYDVYPYLVTPGTDDPNPAYFKPESGKYLHPNPTGAKITGEVIWAGLQVDGFGAHAQPDAVTGNIFPYGQIDNSNAKDGTLSTNATGQVAHGFTLLGTSTTTPQSRVGAVSALGQRITYNAIAGEGASNSYTLQISSNVTTGYSTGDSLFGWAVMQIVASSNNDGPYVQIDDVGSTTYSYYGLNKAGATTGFMPTTGVLYVRTPIFTVQAGNTGLKIYARGQLNAPAGQAASVDMYVKSIGIKKVTAGQYW